MSYKMSFKKNKIIRNNQKKDKKDQDEHLTDEIPYKNQDCCCICGRDPVRTNLDFLDYVTDLETRTSNAIVFDSLIPRIDGLQRRVLVRSLLDSINNINTTIRQLTGEGGGKSMETETRLEDRLKDVLKEMTKIHRGNIVDNAYADELYDNASRIVELLTEINGMSVDLLNSIKQTVKHQKRKNTQNEQ